MKKKIFGFILMLCLFVPCAITLTGCLGIFTVTHKGENIVYTVDESEWELNFSITKTQKQSQGIFGFLSNSAETSIMAKTSLNEITSYTLSAQGVSYDVPGSGVLKLAPNGMDMQFYIDDVLQDEQTKTISSTDPQYIGLKAMLMSYFSFSGKYNDFTFDETKNTYVAENFTISVINEDDISKTYDLHNKKAEVKFLNGYLDTISIELCEDNTFAEITQTFEFTFSDINNTIVTLND